ncbi:mCG1049071 [Mus musculus]|nr:mCG1049071 [Mus musculus]
MWLLGFELWTFGRAVGCSYPLSHLTSPEIIFIIPTLRRQRCVLPPSG